MILPHMSQEVLAAPATQEGVGEGKGKGAGKGVGEGKGEVSSEVPDPEICSTTIRVSDEGEKSIDNAIVMLRAVVLQQT